MFIEELGQTPLPTRYGDWTFTLYQDQKHHHHCLLVFGEAKETIREKDVLVRIHSSCHTSEIFHAINCECARQLQKAMQLIQKEKKGIVIYLDQEGRGNGIKAKISQLKQMFIFQKGRIQPRVDLKTNNIIDTVSAFKKAGYSSERRDFTLAVLMLKRLKITSIRLLTNNPRKIFQLEKAGIKVTPVKLHIPPENGMVATDLRSKAKNLGHHIDEKHWRLKKK